MGVISGCGSTLPAFSESIYNAKSSLGPVTRFSLETYPVSCRVASEVNDFDPAPFFDNPKSIKSNDRYTHFAVAASRLAMEDAGIPNGGSTGSPSNLGVLIGSAFGGGETYERETAKLYGNPSRPKVSPFTIPSLLGNIASGVVGIEVNAQGPNYGVVSACASGSHCIGSAARMIRDGEATQMIAGGSEAAVTPLLFAGFCAMKAMCTDFNDEPTKASRPFDDKRAGFVMGEGAGVLVLESLESAKKRNARIYCEVAGFGASCDAHHITTPAPEGRGLADAMERAFRNSGVPKTDVHYVNAHGTSTAYNDRFETMAIKSVFGEHAAKGKANGLVVSSTKGVTGHTLGAAGGIEAVVAALAVHNNRVPPTANLENPSDDCDLDYVPKVARDMHVEAAMSTNLGFGGQNAALLFKKYKE
jgi:3-oxoacyl-[acyl-carrier-protein] synthase II